MPHCGSLFTETYRPVHLGEPARHLRVSSLWKPKRRIVHRTQSEATTGCARPFKSNSRTSTTGSWR